MPELKEIVGAYLEEHGYDGLLRDDYDCACNADDLFPCAEPSPRCEAGDKCPCNCGDHDWHIGPRLQLTEQEEGRVMEERLDLEAIRARWESRIEAHKASPGMGWMLTDNAWQDVSALIVEVERLRGQRDEELRKKLQAQDSNDANAAAREKAEAEAGRLRGALEGLLYEYIQVRRLRGAADVQIEATPAVGAARTALAGDGGNHDPSSPPAVHGGRTWA